MNKEISEMTSEELRIACAKVLGKLEECTGGDCYQDERGYWICDKCELWRYGYDEVNSPHYKPFPHYDTDRNALMELILAVPEEKQAMFIAELIKIANINEKSLYGWFYDSMHREICNLLTASPEAVMRAFLEIMEEK